MNKARLLKLAKLLEADAKKSKGVSFDMDVWGEIRDGGKPLSCTTRACALGLAALSGAFKREGLSYHVSKSSRYIEFTWKGRAADPLSAAEALFGLSQDQSNYLFVPDTLDTKGASAERAVAKQIRAMVKEG